MSHTWSMGFAFRRITARTNFNFEWRLWYCNPSKCNDNCVIAIFRWDVGDNVCVRFFTFFNINIFHLRHASTCCITYLLNQQLAPLATVNWGKRNVNKTFRSPGILWKSYICSITFSLRSVSLVLLQKVDWFQKVQKQGQITF